MFYFVRKEIKDRSKFLVSFLKIGILDNGNGNFLIYISFFIDEFFKIYCFVM